MIITIVGMNGSGKTTVRRYFLKKHKQIINVSKQLLYIDKFIRIIIPFSSGTLKKRGEIYIKREMNFFYFSRCFLNSFLLYYYKFSKKIYLSDNVYPFQFLYLFKHNKISKIYLAILKTFIPKPALSFVFVNNPAESYERRTKAGYMNYEIGYFQLLYENYIKLTKGFKYTILIEADSMDKKLKITNDYLSEFLSGVELKSQLKRRGKVWLILRHYWFTLCRYKMSYIGYLLTGYFIPKLICCLLYLLPKRRLRQIVLLSTAVITTSVTIGLSFLLNFLTAILILVVFSCVMLSSIIIQRRLKILNLQKRAKKLFNVIEHSVGKYAFTLWSEWPISPNTRESVEIVRKSRPGKELTIGHIDANGRLLGLFGELYGFKNIKKDDFVERSRYLLDVVLIGDRALVRKDFRGDRLSFLREWYSLIVLYNKANIPAIHHVDEEHCLLYKNLVLGHSPLSDGSIKSKDFLLEMENQLDKIHACGVTGVNLLPGSIIIDFKNSTPWFTDFDDAQIHPSTSSLIFAYRRNTDRINFNKIYKRNLITEQSARAALSKSNKYTRGRERWYSPVDFGNGLTIGRFWSTDSGTGRWEFFNKKVVAPLAAGKRVLDLGSNDGTMCFMMLRSGAREVIGIEISPIFAERAKFLHKIFEWQDIKNYAFQIYNCDMREILEADWGKFDVVTAFASLYYLPDDDIAKIVRRASELAPTMIIQSKIVAPPSPKVGSDRAKRASVAFLKEMLEKNGFPQVEIFIPPHYHRPLLVGRATK